ncbi:MAG TPA: endonuclease/exonuclease/phosphatase family protein [Anaerolineaceae bacterium]
MNILTWNCQGAFRKKYPLIATFKPDLAVIQECETLEKITWKHGMQPGQSLWFGDKPTKGVGIFSWTTCWFQVHESYDPAIRYCIPLEITAPISFRAIAVWAMDDPKDRFSYSAQVYQAIGRYREFILGGDTIVLGDFNSNARTTPSSRIGNYTTLNNNLYDLWLSSAYHIHTLEKQGKERRATYYQGRKLEHGRHIDYIYVPNRWLRGLKSVAIGNPQEWLEHSDHCPVQVEIQPPSSRQAFQG